MSNQGEKLLSSNSQEKILKNKKSMKAAGIWKQKYTRCANWWSSPYWRESEIHWERYPERYTDRSPIISNEKFWRLEKPRRNIPKRNSRKNRRSSQKSRQSLCKVEKSFKREIKKVKSDSKRRIIVASWDSSSNELADRPVWWSGFSLFAPTCLSRFMQPLLICLSPEILRQKKEIPPERSQSTSAWNELRKT